MIDVSVIICTADRVAELRKTLAALNLVTAPSGLKCELIVVDNGSLGALPDLKWEFPRTDISLHVIKETRRGLSCARNAGITAAQGDILLFTDDDIRPGSDWVTGMCHPLLTDRADAVAGGVSIAPHLSHHWMTAAHRKLLASTEDSDAAHPVSMVGANMAFSRRVLERVPVFDEELGPGTSYGGEEGLFSMQLKAAGFRLVSAYETSVEHHPDARRLTRTEFLVRVQREGHSLAYFARHWEHKKLRHFGLRYVKNSLRLAVLRHRHRNDLALQEGMPEWEMEIVRGLAFYKQFIIEARLPRKYDQYGLIKRQG